MPLLLLLGVGSVGGFALRDSLDGFFNVFTGNPADTGPTGSTSVYTNPVVIGLLALAAGMILNELID